jgi:hypothetical protein
MEPLTEQQQKDNAAIIFSRIVFTFLFTAATIYAALTPEVSTSAAIGLGIITLFMIPSRHCNCANEDLENEDDGD